MLFIYIKCFLLAKFPLGKIFSTMCLALKRFLYLIYETEKKFSLKSKNIEPEIINNNIC